MKEIFQRLRYARINSAIGRKLLGLYYKDGRIYRVPFGPLKGLRIRYERCVNFHAVLGVWDLYIFDILKRLIKTGIFYNGITACDIGANIGVYSLWFSRYLDKDSKIYSFEPAPYAAERLKDNISINGIANIEVVEAACSDHSGEVEFFVGYHHHTSSLDKKCAGGIQNETERINVKSTTVDDFFYGKETRQAPQVIKMDIEGGAVFALKGCDRCIKDKRPFILIESHMPEEDLAISRIIQEHDYRAFRFTDRQWVKNIKEVFPDTQGVWGTLLLCPAETRKNMERMVP